MNGPQHFREAERLAGQAYRFVYGDGADPVTGAALAALGQVHATLALGAATIAAAPDGVDADIADQWEAVLYVPAPDPADDPAGDDDEHDAFEGAV